MNQGECWDNVDVSAHSDAEPDIKTNTEYKFECGTFRDKVYIPKRSYKKFLKPWYIGTSIAIIILIIIIAATINIKKASVRSDLQESSSFISLALIIRDNDSLWSYSPKDTSITLFEKTENTIGAFDLNKGKTTFWSKANSSKIMFTKNQHGNIMHKTSDSIFEEARFKVQALALDFFTEKLYAIDESTGTLVVIELQTKKYGIVLTDLKKPHDILLDPAQGLMFILQLSNSILRGNMDGTALEEIISNTNVTAMAIDHKTERIYWISDLNTIESSYYNGSNRFVILTDHVNIISLCILDNQLFWLWPANGPNNATLWSCRIYSESCKNHQMQPITLRNASYIKAYSNWSDISRSHPCIHHNGGCQQMCLLSSKINAGRSCGCYLGWELNSDPRTCQLVKQFILYTIGNTARGRILDFARVSFTDVILPTRFYTKSLSQKNMIDFDYDARNDDFYFSDDFHIYKMNLKRASNQTVVQTCTSSHYIEDLAFDWLSQNLYYSKCSKSLEDRHSIQMFNVKQSNKFQRTLQYFRYRDGFGLKGCPYSTVIEPYQGYIFFSAEDINSRSIYRMTLNGTRLRMPSTNIDFVHEFRLLTIDYEKDRLYWIHHSTAETSVRHVNFEGFDENYIFIKNMMGARTIYISQQWMYLSNEWSIWRGSKYTGKNFVKIIPRSGTDLDLPVSSMRIVNLTLQSANDNNPCSLNNGGCEQFCYSAPRQSCDCMDGQNVKEDGRCV